MLEFRRLRAGFVYSLSLEVNLSFLDLQTQDYLENLGKL